MGKRAQREHDATMEVSASQLVPSKPPTAPRMPPGGGKNDASLWAYRVVGTDDFVPSPKKKPSRRPLWIAAGVLGAGAAAGVGYAVLSNGGDDAPAAEAVAAKPDDKPATPDKPPTADKPATPDTAAAKPGDKAVAKPGDKSAKPGDKAAAKPGDDKSTKIADAAKADDKPDAITGADPKAKPKRGVKKTAAVTVKKKPVPKRR